jgi:hypothetical protein
MNFSEKNHEYKNIYKNFMSKTIVLSTGVRIEQDKNGNIVSISSPYMNYNIYNWSLSKKTPWNKIKTHELLSVN